MARQKQQGDRMGTVYPRKKKARKDTGSVVLNSLQRTRTVFPVGLLLKGERTPNSLSPGRKL